MQNDRAEVTCLKLKNVLLILPYISRMTRLFLGHLEEAVADTLPSTDNTPVPPLPLVRGLRA